MNEELKKSLLERNNKIINVVLNEIEKKCPNTIDLIGIAGSFCNGTFYEKSDLDLVIIANDIEKSKVISKCFIMNGVGFDIYISSWDHFKTMSQYNNQYVTKLKKLDIVYTKNDEVLNRYEMYQKELNKNMNDSKRIKAKVNRFYSLIESKYKRLLEIKDKNDYYRLLGSITSYMNNIVYMMNKEYVHGSSKNTIEEMSNMNIPDNYIENYKILFTSTNIEKINYVLKKLIWSIKLYYDLEDINAIDYIPNYKIRSKISSKELTGTYEELFSNYYNKLYHAVDINNRYLSFRTMVDAQEFFDDLYEVYDIPKIDFVGKYNPNDLKANAIVFEKVLNEWKKIYDSFDKEIEIYSDVDDIYKGRSKSK